MHSSFYYSSSISETLDIVERGLRRLGISGHGVSRIPPRAMQCEKAEPAPVTSEMVGRMVELTRKGLTQSQIANELGCSQSAVSKNLTRLGMRQARGRKVAA